MVKSIIDFSKALNIKITAEFVHNAEVYKRLIDLKSWWIPRFLLRKTWAKNWVILIEQKNILVTIDKLNTKENVCTKQK